MRRLLIPLMLLAAAPAFAQDSDLSARLDRMERDLNLVQKQVYNNASSTSSSDGASAPTNSGALDVRISQLEEQMRDLRGEVEQIQYANTKNTQDLQKYMGDTDYRLQALEQKAAAADAAAAAAAQQQAATTAPAAAPEAPAAPATYQKEPAAADAATPAAPTTSPTGKDFPNSNAAYSFAFKQLHEKDYSAAASSFDNFVHTYPNDPLTANAYYWLGESYYARGDYTRSAEAFRKGFENSPDGQKAPDNLLKLAMSLDKVKRTKEACIVLKQITGKYADASPRVASKAQEEIGSMQCK